LLSIEVSVPLRHVLGFPEGGLLRALCYLGGCPLSVIPWYGSELRSSSP
jgi:hypothetical protein